MARASAAIRQVAREVDIADILSLRGRTATRVSRIILDGIGGRLPIAQVRLRLALALDISDSQAMTLYDTALSIYRRQLKLASASGDNDELFFYVGPLDEMTRGFCLDLIGKVRSRAEISELDNGQLPDPLLTGGGYNCRHIWQRVSVLDTKLQALHSTGKRAAHIERRLRAIADGAAA